MKVYMVSDIEGVAGVVFYEHRHPSMSPMLHDLLVRNRVLLTEEVNAAARGAFDAGASEVVIMDRHGGGYNIMPELLDRRLELIHGRAGQCTSLGILYADFDETWDALVLLGMHAKAGTQDGATPHSLICVEDGEGGRHELSEATMGMALAGDCNVPAVFLAGDKATCEDALAIVPSLETVFTKKHYASQVARTISPAMSRERIEAGVKRALLRRWDIPPFRIPGPCTVQIADRNPEARWPKAPNTKPTFSEALIDSLLQCPWHEPVTKIDDGWRFPDRTAPSPMPNDQWNSP